VASWACLGPVNRVASAAGSRRSRTDRWHRLGGYSLRII
jgi:hypothetical protein